MDTEAHITEMTLWYCRLVNEPGFRQYTLERVKYMAERQPMYAAMREAVVAASSSPSPAQSSERAAPSPVAPSAATPRSARRPRP